MTFADRLIDRAMQRRPDFIIGGEADPYLFRWYVIPRNRFLNIYLHCFKRSDDDRAHHGHPWLANFSRILRGECAEHTIAAGGTHHRRLLRAGDTRFRWGASPHRIELVSGDCWTLFVTGPKVREWGFNCPQRWIHWQEFTSPHNSGEIGRGCD